MTTTSRHEIRELALQALYQLDARSPEDTAEVEQTVMDAPNRGVETRQAAMEMARKAWSHRSEADAMATELAPAWPTSRQPPIDRSILRLAYFELATGAAPARVAINEAVELAKAYGTERSPSFINGVLDRMMRRLQEKSGQTASEAEPKTTSDPWLADAIRDARDGGETH